MSKGRKKRLPATVRVVHLTVDATIVDELDKWVEDINGATPIGGATTLTSLVRDLLRRCVEERRAEKSAPKT